MSMKNERRAERKESAHKYTTAHTHACNHFMRFGHTHTHTLLKSKHKTHLRVEN